MSFRVLKHDAVNCQAPSTWWLCVAWTQADGTESVMVVLSICGCAFCKPSQLTPHYILQKLLVFTVLAALIWWQHFTEHVLTVSTISYIVLMYIILQSTLLSRVELGNENYSRFHTSSKLLTSKLFVVSSFGLFSAAWILYRCFAC